MMDEKNITQLFMQLVLQNQQMAMISLGKVKNPVSDTLDKNLEYAKLSIDTLDMLNQKTKGNLSEQEEKFLSESLTQLKVLYVEESAKEKKPEHKPNKENQEKE
ncbi:MAG: DUF1844 domain-containing protein [Ignavibacteriaceae bacterium]